MTQTTDEVQDDLPTFCYTWDQNFPKGKEPFLGLYRIGAAYEHRIIRRSREPISPFQFTSDHGAQGPYFVQDPIAWALLPEIHNRT
jgi:hypothetical protein